MVQIDEKECYVRVLSVLARQRLGNPIEKQCSVWQASQSVVQREMGKAISGAGKEQFSDSSTESSGALDLSR
jgi:hypothetical protein